MTAVTVADLIHDAVDHGGFDAEDLRAIVGPLLREVAVVHEQGLVAPLRGLGAIGVADGRRLSIAAVPPTPPSHNRARLQEIQRPVSAAVDVIEAGQPVTRPLFVVGYETWEHQLGHHDAATDIESLGLLLASLALGFDFRVADDLRRFVSNRRNLFVLRPELHPVIGRLIGETAEPDRNLRAQDVASLAERLDSYRDQPIDFDLALVPGAASGPIPRRRAAIQTALRDRLFEINRRNRLVYFTPTQQSVNMTVGSVPLLVDPRNLTADHLATWRPPLSTDVVAGKHVKLNTVLRFEDAPYLPAALAKLGSQARRDRAEYGVAQLRLVVCFLRWHNLKDDKDERINSPLLLLPVELTTKRGVRDSHALKATTPVAEVNPALRHHLRQLYGIELPETIDLEEQTVDDLHAMLQAQIEATEPGVVLEKVDRPPLDLVQRQAQLRLDQYRRRQQAALHGTAEPSDERADASAVDDRPGPVDRIVDGAAPRANDRLASTLAEPQSETANPYRWELDLCSLTIANFNYRKMTLVRDYAQLIAADEPSDAFDRIFSLDARPLDDDLRSELPLADQHLVVAADETQRAAIAKARAGRSFIIQGPPGTGKSQTITNLIADYVARGKRVLFVCAKRAAIDVVYARLRKQGLDELCALIHDSQADKRAFIHGMRTTYESWLVTPDAADAAESARTQLIDAMGRRLDALERLDAAMATRPAGADRDLRSLLERAAELRDTIAPTDDGAVGAVELPTVAEWYGDAPTVHAIADTLTRLGEPPVLADHPIADVRAELLTADRPVERLAAAAGALTNALMSLADQLASAGVDADTLTVGDVHGLAELADTAAQLAPNALPVLTPGSPAAAALAADVAGMSAARAAAQHAAEAAAGWREPLAPGEAATALEVATAKEPSAFKFLSGSWRSVKKTVRARYDFGRHAVRPTITSVLTDLVAWQRADEHLRRLQQAAHSTYGVADLEPLHDRIARAHSLTAPVPAAVRDDPGRLRGLVDVRATFHAAIEAIDGLWDVTTGTAAWSIADVTARTARLRGATGAMRELVADLQRLHAAAPAVVRLVRSVAETPDRLEALVLDRAIDQFGLQNLDVDRFTGRELATHLGRLHADHVALLDANAAVARARARSRFAEHVAISAASSAQLVDADAKAFKKAYAAGRRELEHEFEKTMRYRSIRELASGATGPVVMDLRPIWLMSPLSVSDTLPLDPGEFDVVVFDEASQIPLEEAIPALYRAHQTIVVGDQMQLPPTTFFSTAGSRDEEVDVLDDDEDDSRRVAVVLDGDSFLAQSAAALPSTLLAWHYRSRSEDLIGFSNAAFYGGALATVPDRHRPPEGLGPIVIDTGTTPDAAVDALLARNISFHAIPGAVYEARRNRAEAAYVAEMVRSLLRRRLGLTVGIAAFSEAQQAEIEDALERLADEDDEFGDLLDAEEQREDDDQFVGLFVKNLENIQGDERDVIIISVCYGPGPDGRVRMNFGPINQQGGEKRLNVIFSRARQRMAIVSSIRAPQITNEHNDGANALRRFLDYAEATSAGDTDRAQRVLDAANPMGRSRAEIAGRSTVTDGLATALRSRGLAVEAHHGRSRFRCDLAVRQPDDADHRVAVLVDTRERAALAPTDERALMHPAILDAFGWRVVHVLTKDWYADPESVIAAVESALG